MRNPTERLEAVAFDMDGLMFNTEALYAQVGGEMLRRRGKQVTRELLNKMMGRPSAAALQIMIDWHQLDDSIAQLELETEEILIDLMATQLAPLPGLLDLLESLDRAAIPCAVATSSRRVFVDRALELTKLTDRFQFVLSCEDITHGKPAPEIYLKAASRFAVAPSRMMVLEDSHIGSRAAVAAEAWTVAVPGEHSHDHDFSHVAWVARSLADPGIYENLGLTAQPAS